MGRATQGVRLINLTKKNDVIASVCKVMSSELEATVEAESRQKMSNAEERFSEATNAHALSQPAAGSSADVDESRQSDSEK